MDILRVETMTVNELSPALLSAIQIRRAREFGDDSMTYAHPQWHLLGYLDDVLVAQVGVLQRTIAIGRDLHLIGGVGFLVTEPDYRGRGFAAQIMNGAVAFLKDKLRLSFALLTCKPRLESLYTGMGWRTVSESNVFVQPTGNRACGGLIMIHECGGDSWPGGKIDFCGLPW
jgi:GNAT superfamily N-acetyltransferase